MRPPHDYDIPDLLDNIGKLHWLIDLSKDRPDQDVWRDEASAEMWRLIDELHRRGVHYPLPH
jgi:hypothetical protein